MAQSVDRAPLAVTTTIRELGVVQFVDRPRECRQTHFWPVFKLDSEFISDPNSEFLVSFFCGLSVYIKRVIISIDCNLN